MLEEDLTKRKPTARSTKITVNEFMELFENVPHERYEENHELIE